MMSVLSLQTFDYHLPPELIAQKPADTRSGSRLLHLGKGGRGPDHLTFSRFPELLREGDLVVINDTKVFPARLAVRRQTGGALEVFLLQYPEGKTEVPCLVRPGRRVRETERVFLEDGSTLKVSRRGEGFSVSGEGVGLEEAVRKWGRIPLPPYITRSPEGGDEEDRVRYQTVYASREGAVAAPTAGLHFDEAVLKRVRERNISVASVTLHVGPGTFTPVREADVTRHRMESEDYQIPEDTAQRIRRTKASGGRIVAVGTTVVRTLESAWTEEKVNPGRGRTSLFIHPGYSFSVVDALLTNFHLPRSTLLMLVCAFGGTDRVMEAYREAVSRGYRFYSYGDAMFIE